MINNIKINKAYFFKKYALFLYLFFYFYSQAQLENSNWILNSKYSLKFTNASDHPTLDSAIYGTSDYPVNNYQPESISSISDKKGNLLFYSDGNFVWDKTRNVMQNGTLAGNAMPYTNTLFFKANAIILPDLNDTTLYYILVNDHINQRNTYSIIDIKLNGGKGGVLPNKKMIQYTTEYYYKFNAIASDSCGVIWLLGRKQNGDSKIIVYELTSEGIKYKHKTSVRNPINEYTYYDSPVSGDGTLFPVITENKYEIIEIYSFNKKNGYISLNPKYVIDEHILSITSYNFQNEPAPRVRFFSKTNKSLYVFSWGSNYLDSMFTYKIDLTNLSSTNCITLIDSVNISSSGMMMIENQKIFMSLHIKKINRLTNQTNMVSGSIGVIENPDFDNLSLSGYNKNLFRFPKDKLPNLPYQGLVNYYGRPKPRPRITLPTQQICSQTPFSLSADVSNLPQVQSGKQIWYLNDTEVISYNPNDQYTIDEPGVYKLSFRHEECIEHTTITVTAPPVHNIPPKDSLCEGKFLQLTSTGILQIKNSVNLPILPPVSVAGNYTFTVLGCNTTTGSFGLSVTQKPNLILPNTLAGCLLSGVVLQPIYTTTLGQNLLWSNGSNAQNQSITTSGIFTITVSNRCFTEQKSAQISLLSKPILPKFAPDTTICEDKNITILGNQNLQATEQSSNKTYFSNNNILILTQAGIYTISQSNVCHTSTGIMEFKTLPKPNLILPNTLAGCLPLGVQLEPLFTTSLGQNLLWSNGSNAQNQSITTSGIFTITVSNRCFAEQKSTQISLLSKPILPKFAPDTTICEGKNITIFGNQNLQATKQSSNKTYFSNNNILTLTQAGIYTISQSNVCHTTTSNIVIKTDNFPIFTVPKDTVICDSTSFSFAAIRNKNANTSLIWNDGNTENNRTISQPGTYEIVIKNSCGEFKKAFKITFASSKIGFKNTNIFTPNGDNSNDEWQPTTESSESYKLEIFNRQGTKVFQSEQWNESWQAQSQPDGIYFYHISYLDCNQQTKSLKGWVEVRR